MSRPVETAGGSPPRTSLADLLVLVLGSAIALSQPWYSGEPHTTFVAGRRAPGWYVASSYAIEGLQKAAVGLIPLIVYRSWRSRRPIPATEYPLLLIGLAHFAHMLSKAPLFHLYYVDPDHPGSLLVHVVAYEIWERCEFGVGIVAALFVAIRRRFPPDWLGGISTAIAWNQLTLWGIYFFRKWANGWLFHFLSPTAYTMVLSSIFLSIPLGVIDWLPLAMAVIDLRRQGHRDRPWVGWLALSLAIALFVLFEVRFQTRTVLESRPYDLGYYLHVTTQVASLGLSFPIAARLEPLWRRLLGADPPAKGFLNGSSG